jgi:hypothetical protein
MVTELPTFELAEISARRTVAVPAIRRGLVEP